MTNLILFINSFLSYLLVFAVSIVVIGVAVFAGYKMRVRKDAKTAAMEKEQAENGQGQATDIQ